MTLRKGENTKEEKVGARGPGGRGLNKVGSCQEYLTWGGRKGTQRRKVHEKRTPTGKGSLLRGERGENSRENFLERSREGTGKKN